MKIGMTDMPDMIQEKDLTEIREYKITLRDRYRRDDRYRNDDRHRNDDRYKRNSKHNQNGKI